MSLLIGLVDQAISPSDKVSWSDSKIGGHPVWMSNFHSSAHRKCPGCTIDMTLVVQLYCPLSNSAYHRCLYIFVCASTGCPQYNRYKQRGDPAGFKAFLNKAGIPTGMFPQYVGNQLHVLFRSAGSIMKYLPELKEYLSNWKVFRGMEYDEAYAPTKSKKESSSQLFDSDMWTDDQDDWGDDGDDDNWGDTISNNEWGDGTSDFGNTASRNIDNNSTSQHPHSNHVNTDSKAVPSLTPSLDRKDRAGCVNGESSSFEACDRIAETKEISNNSSSHTATDEDLSACFSVMDVAETTNNSKGEGDTLMEDLNVPDTSRLDQLATVLNTKYKDSASNDLAASRQPIQLKPYYLSVVEGSCHQSHNTKDDRHIAGLIREYEEVEGKQIKEIISERAQSKGKGGSEGYEKSSVKHGDKVFHKFWKEIQKFPEQCIRYDRCGQPLLVQSLNPVQSIIPPCLQCGTPRVFELQLVPALIPWLSSQEGKSSNIEFGAILVYTCEKSCPPSHGSDLGLLEEHVIFQHDPDHHLYR